jgi:hypothetical protein
VVRATARLPVVDPGQIALCGGSGGGGSIAPLMKEAGVRVEYREYPGYGHGFYFGGGDDRWGKGQIKRSLRTLYETYLRSSRRRAVRRPRRQTRDRRNAEPNDAADSRWNPAVWFGVRSRAADRSRSTMELECRSQTPTTL